MSFSKIEEQQRAIARKAVETERMWRYMPYRYNALAVGGYLQLERYYSNVTQVKPRVKRQYDIEPNVDFKLINRRGSTFIIRLSDRPMRFQEG